MEKPSLTLFNLSDECKFYAELKSYCKDSDKFEFHDFSDIKKAQTCISSTGNAIFVFQIRKF